MGIKWETDPNTFRNVRAEVGDYLLVIQGAGRYEFNWVVFYQHNEIASSVTLRPCRNVPEAQRICAAVYHVANNLMTK